MRLCSACKYSCNFFFFNTVFLFLLCDIKQTEYKIFWRLISKKIYIYVILIQIGYVQDIIDNRQRSQNSVSRAYCSVNSRIRLIYAIWYIQKVRYTLTRYYYHICCEAQKRIHYLYKIKLKFCIATVSNLHNNWKRCHKSFKPILNSWN